jgi:hypothetical protein
MKTFTEYLTESKKQYDFRVKIAGDFTTEQETQLKGLLDRYTVSSFKKTKKTPIQELPLDFPQVKNCEVNIYEVTVDYPTTSHELTEYLSSGLSVAKSHLVIRRPSEPGEEYQQPVEKRKGALLDDPDYKESPNAKFEDYYGDKYNSGFVKELNDLLKLQRKERGEKIPTEAGNEVKLETATKDANTKSILKQAADPRKK